MDQEIHYSDVHPGIKVVRLDSGWYEVRYQESRKNGQPEIRLPAQQTEEAARRRAALLEVNPFIRRRVRAKDFNSLLMQEDISTAPRAQNEERIVQQVRARVGDFEDDTGTGLPPRHSWGVLTDEALSTDALARANHQRPAVLDRALGEIAASPKALASFLDDANRTWRLGNDHDRSILFSPERVQTLTRAAEAIPGGLEKLYSLVPEDEEGTRRALERHPGFSMRRFNEFEAVRKFRHGEPGWGIYEAAQAAKAGNGGIYLEMARNAKNEPPARVVRSLVHDGVNFYGYPAQAKQLVDALTGTSPKGESSYQFASWLPYMGLAEIYQHVKTAHADGALSADEAAKYLGAVRNHRNYVTDEASAIPAIGDFWLDYERRVRAKHFATVKHLVTGQPVDGYVDHRGDVGSSDEYEQLIPHMRRYGEIVAGKVLQDAGTAKVQAEKRGYRLGLAPEIRIFRGAPHVRVYRGVGGEYGAAIAKQSGWKFDADWVKPEELPKYADDAAATVDRKILNIPVQHLSSWSIDPAVAAQFAATRKVGFGHHPVVIERWMPLAQLLHAGMYDAYDGQSHGHFDEHELVFAHEKPTMKISASNLRSVYAEDGYSSAEPPRYKIARVKVRPAAAPQPAVTQAAPAPVAKAEPGVLAKAEPPAPGEYQHPDVKVEPQADGTYLVKVKSSYANGYFKKPYATLQEVGWAAKALSLNTQVRQAIAGGEDQWGFADAVVRQKGSLGSQMDGHLPEEAVAAFHRIPTVPEEHYRGGANPLGLHWVNTYLLPAIDQARAGSKYAEDRLNQIADLIGRHISWASADLFPQFEYGVASGPEERRSFFTPDRVHRMLKQWTPLRDVWRDGWRARSLGELADFVGDNPETKGIVEQHPSFDAKRYHIAAAKSGGLTGDWNKVLRHVDEARSLPTTENIIPEIAGSLPELTEQQQHDLLDRVAAEMPGDKERPDQRTQRIAAHVGAALGFGYFPGEAMVEGTLRRGRFAGPISASVAGRMHSLLSDAVRGEGGSQYDRNLRSWIAGWRGDKGAAGELRDRMNGVFPEDALIAHTADFWRRYERRVRPEHFATVKSFFTGGPVTLIDHRKETGSSDKSVVPGVPLYAREAQRAVLEGRVRDPVLGKISIRRYGGKPYIRVFRGIGGEYGHSIAQAVGMTGIEDRAPVVEKRRVRLPVSSFSSWSVNPAIAARFAATRDGFSEKHVPVVLERWMPVEDLLHSGFHDAHPLQQHAHTDENELIFGHRDERISIPSSCVHLGVEGGPQDYMVKRSRVKGPPVPEAASAPSGDLGKAERPANKPEVSLVVAYDPWGRLLLGRRKDNGRWTLPGGHIHQGEKPDAAAKREMFEETGLRPWSLTPIEVRQPSHVNLHVFTALASGTAHGRLDPDREAAEWRYFDVSDRKLPAVVYDAVHGPPGDENVLRQMFGRRLPGAELTKAEPGERPRPLRTPKKPSTKPTAPAAKEKDAEPRPLIAVHNLSAGNLRHAHDLGGLAAPSLAVIHRDHGMDGFGEITLIAHPDMVDPQQGAPVFDADIYSPRHPQTKFRLDPKAVERMHDWLRPHYATTGAYYNSMEEELENRGVDGPIEHRGLVPALEEAYLYEQGVKLEPPMRDVALNNPWSGEPAMREFFARRGRDINFQFGNDYHREMSQAAQAAQESWAKKVAADEGEPESWKVWINDRLFDEAGFLGYGQAHNIYDDFGKLGTREVDQYPYHDILKQKVDELGRPAFEAWARQKLAPVVGQQYIPKMTSSGSWRKIPYNLDTLLREMTRTVRQGEGFNYGLGSARALGAKRFGSLEGIRRAKDKLVSPDQMEQAKKVLNEHFNELASSLRTYHPHENQFGVMDIIASAIGDSYRRGWSMARALHENGFQKVPTDLVVKAGKFARELVNAPTEYFESKPQRVVRLNEFKSAVVPHDAAQDVLDILAQHGITHIERYKKDAEGDRAAAIRRAADAHNLALSESDLGEPLVKTDGLANHAHPGERALQALQAPTPMAWFRAALDEHPDVVQAALARREIPSYLMKLLAQARCDRTGAPLGRRILEYVTHSAAKPEHVARAHQVAKGAE